MEVVRVLLFTNALLHAALLLILYLRHRRNATHASSWQALLPLVLTCLLSCLLLSFFTLYDESGTAPTQLVLLGFILALFCLVSLSVSIGMLYLRSRRSRARLDELQTQLIRSEEEQKQLQALIVQHQAMREFRHEIKNVLLGLWGYLQAKDYRQLRQLLEEQLQGIVPSKAILETGYPALDALIAAKAQQARILGADLRISIVLPSPPAIAERDICTIIGNAFDNALEATRLLPEQDRFIFLFTRQYNTTWQVEMVNGSNGAYLQDGEHLRSTKEDQQTHGIGLGLIERLAAHYDGYVHIQPEEKRFILAVYLPLE